MVATVRKLRSRDGSAFVATPSPSYLPAPQLGFHQGTDKGNSISTLESPGRPQLKGAKRNMTGLHLEGHDAAFDPSNFTS